MPIFVLVHIFGEYVRLIACESVANDAQFVMSIRKMPKSNIFWIS